MLDDFAGSYDMPIVRYCG